MVVKIKQIILLSILTGNIFFSFGQNSTVRSQPIDYPKTKIVTRKMVFDSKDTLYQIVRIEYCEGQTKTFFLNGLELPFDSLVKLNLRKIKQSTKQSFYELRYKENDPLNCIEHINYYITVKIPIFVNGVMAQIENSYENTKSIEIISLKMLYPHSKKKNRIDVLIKILE